MTTPEEAANYLRRTNFKALIEWLTAECILHRPEDPLSFCKAAIEGKVAGRGGTGYSSEAPMEFLKATYAKASNSADEHGRIYGNVEGGDIAESSSVATPSDGDGAVRERLETLEMIIESCREIAMELDPVEAQKKIIGQTCRTLKADRATIFRVDEVTNELLLQVAEGAKNIRLPLGRGIAGTVAQTGETINIADAYEDARFDQTHDQKSGYRTHSILCGPVKKPSGEIIGVLQVINKAEGTFTETDEGILEILCSQAGICLQNADLFSQTERSRSRFRSLLDIINALQGDMGLSSLLFTMTREAPRVVDADRATIFLVDERDDELWSMQGDVNMRFPRGQGIAGSVATTGSTINIPEAYEDDRFNQGVDKSTGYRTRTILCMPIRAAGKIVGVCQAINKKHDGPFNDEDEEVHGP
uniref:GAF domain-containing protein n=1 Tax=Phaeomonas parva TaxID=124430 RepID=A0A7S1UDQ0_9STRA|mmetsp:Transcript_40268/g.125982  ORF Transcript_40268/g.125982 Transcript_40268/m.125982 type:complete len:417 (+) Transcript_40268:78-1328(+)